MVMVPRILGSGTARCVSPVSAMASTATLPIGMVYQSITARTKGAEEASSALVPWRSAGDGEGPRLRGLPCVAEGAGMRAWPQALALSLQQGDFQRRFHGGPAGDRLTLQTSGRGDRGAGVPLAFGGDKRSVALTQNKEKLTATVGHHSYRGAASEPGAAQPQDPPGRLQGKSSRSGASFWGEEWQRKRHQPPEISPTVT